MPARGNRQGRAVSSLGVLCWTALAAACAGQHPAANSGAPPVMSYPSNSSSRVDTIIRNAKIEVANLRSDLALARIAATKKEVELDGLRKDLTQYRQRLTEVQEAKDQHQYAADRQQQELALLRTERERLLKEKSDMQQELADLPQLREALAASRAAESQVQARVKELGSTLAALNEELAARSTTRGKEEPADERAGIADDAVVKDTPNAVTSPVSPEEKQGEESRAKRDAYDEVDKTNKIGAVFVTALSSNKPDWVAVTVKPHDTLWDLARTYGITVALLKQRNGLAGDVIRVGQTLLVPAKHND